MERSRWSSWLKGIMTSLAEETGPRPLQQRVSQESSLGSLHPRRRLDPMGVDCVSRASGAGRAATPRRGALEARATTRTIRA